MKMRKWVSVLLVVAMVGCFTAGCGSSSSTSTGTSTSSSSSKSSSSSSTQTKTIAYITNDTINDGGWNSACYKAMCDVAEKYGYQTSYSEKVAEADYASTFTTYADMGTTVVFAPGNEYTDAVVEVAPSHPDTKFVLLNGDVSGANYASIKCDNVQMGFIAGVLAGLKTKSNTVGYVSAIKITTAIDNLTGYKQGVAYVNPDATVVDAWTDSWTDTAKGKEIANSMITTNKADVFYGNAGTIDTGVREAAAAAGNVYDIAQPDEMLSQAPDVILSSVITDNVKLLSIALDAIEKGNFGNQVYKGGVAEGVLSVGEFGTNAQDIKDKFMTIYQDLKDGKITLAESAASK